MTYKIQFTEEGEYRVVNQILGLNINPDYNLKKFLHITLSMFVSTVITSFLLTSLKQELFTFAIGIIITVISAITACIALTSAVVLLYNLINYAENYYNKFPKFDNSLEAQEYRRKLIRSQKWKTLK